MLKLLISCLLAVISFDSYSAYIQRAPLSTDKCLQFFPFGFPKSGNSNTTFICREGYALEYDKQAKIPLWASYTLSAGKALGCSKRASSFFVDASLPKNASSTVADFASPIYDIGHLVNSADMRWSDEVSKESNILSNTAPMKVELNRGSWKQLEDWIRTYVVENDTVVLIYVGTIRSSISRTIGKNQVAVPEKFFKVVIDLHKNSVMSFIYDQNAKSAPPNSFITSIEDVMLQAKIHLPISINSKAVSKFPVMKNKTISNKKREMCSFD